MNSLDEAISDMKKTIAMKPSDIKYRVDLIETLSEAGRCEEAQIGENTLFYAI
jgi:protein involved in temperature-dependent protein secretion